MIDDTDYYIQSTNMGEKDDNTKETPLLKGNLKDLIRNLKWIINKYFILATKLGRSNIVKLILEEMNMKKSE